MQRINVFRINQFYDSHILNVCYQTVQVAASNGLLISVKANEAAGMRWKQCDQIWRKFTTLAQLGKFLRLYLVFGKILIPLWQKCYAIGQGFLLQMSKYYKLIQPSGYTGWKSRRYFANDIGLHLFRNKTLPSPSHSPKINFRGRHTTKACIYRMARRVKCDLGPSDEINSHLKKWLLRSPNDIPSLMTASILGNGVSNQCMTDFAQVHSTESIDRIHLRRDGCIYRLSCIKFGNNFGPKNSGLKQKNSYKIFSFKFQVCFE